MNHPKRMLVENIAWAAETAETDPAFFDGLVEGQRPTVLWIGCSDSRVPAETVTNSPPGNLFVHRNIANLFAADDDNTLSVVEYAVRVLKVSDVVVCGHHGCGGVAASLAEPPAHLPHVARRIAPLRALAERHRAELDGVEPGIERTNRLAELSVREQVRALREHPLVRDADSPPQVHGWVFGLHDGRLKVLDGGEEAGAEPPPAPVAPSAVGPSALAEPPEPALAAAADAR